MEEKINIEKELSILKDSIEKLTADFYDKVGLQVTSIICNEIDWSPYDEDGTSLVDGRTIQRSEIHLKY